MRYLVRLANNQGYTPKDVKMVQGKIRELLGSADKIGNLRISSTAIEFDLFVEQAELNRSKSLLDTKVSEVVTFRDIDSRFSASGKGDAFREGIDLFNQERFWESHEVLEEIWHPAKGAERDVVQGLILTAAAMVHYQKSENDVCVSILGRAREKLASLTQFKDTDIKRLIENIDQILEDNAPRLFRIESAGTKTAS